ncbi:TniQ family protein [Streptomyces sp. NPDC007991]|uniref:TniQ family protein n=1 Tax=Streptomyces sp. NPDC007991 TaxID=3364803 RepID=UPI0036ED3F49
MRPDAWLYVGSPRFCPSCLAGDGTRAQQLHGGPWLKLWHLPIVFACTKHRIYLEADCPHCGQPHDTLGPLVQRANDHTLHPAQCRWTSTHRPRGGSLSPAPADSIISPSLRLTGHDRLRTSSASRELYVAA